jgi:hypothetical protein
MISDVSSGADFLLDIDHVRGKIVQVPVGYWCLETVVRWEETIRALVERRRAAGQYFRFLVDLRERSPHAQEVAANMQAAWARQAPSFERIAIVLPRSSVMTLQARRVVGMATSQQDHQRHFPAAEMGAAHAWIDDGLGSPARKSA